MQESVYYLKIKNDLLNLQLECQAEKDDTGEYILEYFEQQANKKNKTLGNLKELEIYSESKQGVLNLKLPFHKILNNQKNDELIIRSSLQPEIKPDCSQSDLQCIKILIILNQSEWGSQDQQYFKFSRHDQLSQVADKILQLISKKKEECELQFEIKGVTYRPFQVKLSLGGLNLIDDDVIIISKMIKVYLEIIDGDTKSIQQQILKMSENLSNLSQKILLMTNLDKKASLEFLIKNKLYNESQFEKTLAELGVKEGEKIIAKMRYLGGASNTGKNIQLFRK